MSKNKDLTKTDGMSNSALATIDDLEITALSDDELDAVAGGSTDFTTAASCSCCTAGATNIKILAPM